VTFEPILLPAEAASSIRGHERQGFAAGGHKSPGIVPDEVAGSFVVTGIPMALFILDRLSGENAPHIPGLFERSLTERQAA